MSKPTVLLDVDNTILDIESLKKEEGQIIDANYGEEAQKDLWKIYKQVQEEKGVFDPKEVAMRFVRKRKSADWASILAVFVEADFAKFLLPGAMQLIDYLANNANLVIFSEGHELFQRQKIEKLGLDKISDEVIIARSKKELFGEVARKFLPPFVVIDDNPMVIIEAKKRLSGVKTIWFKFGKHTEEGQNPGADLETDKLDEVIFYLKKIIKS